VLHAPKTVSDPKAWYLHPCLGTEFMTPADDRRVPAMLKGVIDDGAHTGGSGMRGVRNAAPWPRISGLQIHEEPAPVLPAAPHADADATVVVPLDVVVTAQLRRPPELPGADTQGAYPNLHRFGPSESQVSWRP